MGGSLAEAKQRAGDDPAVYRMVGAQQMHCTSDTATRRIWPPRRKLSKGGHSGAPRTSGWWPKWPWSRALGATCEAAEKLGGRAAELSQLGWEHRAGIVATTGLRCPPAWTWRTGPFGGPRELPSEPIKRISANPIRRSRATMITYRLNNDVHPFVQADPPIRFRRVMKKFWLYILLSAAVGTATAWAINYKRFGHREAHALGRSRWTGM